MISGEAKFDARAIIERRVNDLEARDRGMKVANETVQDFLQNEAKV